MSGVSPVVLVGEGGAPTQWGAGGRWPCGAQDGPHAEVARPKCVGTARPRPPLSARWLVCPSLRWMLQPVGAEPPAAHRARGERPQRHFTCLCARGAGGVEAGRALREAVRGGVTAVPARGLAADVPPVPRADHPGARRRRGPHLLQPLHAPALREPSQRGVRAGESPPGCGEPVGEGAHGQPRCPPLLYQAPWLGATPTLLCLVVPRSLWRGGPPGWYAAWPHVGSWGGTSVGARDAGCAVRGCQAVPLGRPLQVMVRCLACVPGAGSGSCSTGHRQGGADGGPLCRHRPLHEWSAPIPAWGRSPPPRAGAPRRRVVQTSRVVCPQALRERKRCVTAHWLNSVLKKKQLVPPHRALHFPVAFPPGGRPCAQHVRPASAGRVGLRGGGWPVPGPR